ncbi:DUF4394 domain-containing protein [uncultured Methylibium sp.]|uniref:DUF4394 domain-containing protein n=1 Tax=uncultured Methylibium sp. TaxID=381093 RepID=UPI0025F35949|nr:DUF4394 domain-containing protein [uncultured Methylibium sp.]
MHRKTLLATVAAFALGGLAACGGGGDAPPPAPQPVAVGDTVALTASGRIVSFNRATPATLVGAVSVTGLASGETLLGIDIRPADGLLYALGSAGNIYTIVPSTGAATLRVALRAAAGDDNPYAALVGDSFAVDFNPAADRLRVIGNLGQNLRINVATGDTITDGLIAPAAGGTATVSAGAYTNSFAGTTTTQLFDLDVVAGTLHLQDPPNNGTLAAGLPLGVTATAANGFDIDARNNTGYAALTVGGTTSLYTVNLTTGAATAVAGGAIAGGEAIRGLALVQPAAPTAIGLTADNRLLAFNPAAPNTITSTTTITGLQTGEVILGIDVRPGNGLLYALATGGRLYTVDPATGAATFRVALAADPADATAPYSGLASNALSVDFNPAADRLRVIADNGQSLRINVDTGLTTTDGDINRVGVAPSVLAAAYANSFAGTTTTVLYDLEAASNVLAIQNPPNNGTLVDVGALGLDIAGSGGFDIAGGGNGLALAALRVGTTGPMSLYAVNLTTGAATFYRGLAADAAQIGGAGGVPLVDLAIRF